MRSWAKAVPPVYSRWISGTYVRAGHILTRTRTRPVNRGSRVRLAVHTAARCACCQNVGEKCDTRGGWRNRRGQRSSRNSRWEIHSAYLQTKASKHSCRVSASILWVGVMWWQRCSRQPCCTHGRSLAPTPPAHTSISRPIRVHLLGPFRMHAANSVPPVGCIPNGKSCTPRPPPRIQSALKSPVPVTPTSTVNSCRSTPVV